MSEQTTRSASHTHEQSEAQTERRDLQAEIADGLQADRDASIDGAPASDSIGLPEPKALSLQEAAQAVGVRRDKVPAGYDGHLEAQKDGDFDRLARAARSEEALSEGDQARLVSFGLRDRLITPGELSPDALEKAWSLTSASGQASGHPPEDEA